MCPGRACGITTISPVKRPGAVDVRAMGPLPQYPIESVDNALKVVLLLAERSELRLTDVSDYLGVSSSSAHRMMAMLVYRGFVRQDAKTRAYHPGTSLTAVAFSVLRRFDFRTSLRPYLEALHRELDETVHLSMLDGTSVCFVDAIEGTKVARTASRVGLSLPASTTASGKVMLAGLSTDELEILYPTEELVTLTDQSIGSREELERQLAQIRRRGYSFSSQESEAGVSSVAVAFPVRDNLPRLAVSTAVPRSRMSQADRRRIGEILAGVVADAARVLGL